jgi:hypothetical protein
MSSWIVCDGDELSFEPMFGTRQVVLSGPAIISGTGLATVSKRRVCVQGDEKRGRWPAQYCIAGYSPGAGMISIEMLGDSQLASYVVGESPLILQGTQFTACFTPTAPAMMSSAPFTPDVTASSMGRGAFVVHQQFVRA